MSYTTYNPQRKSRISDKKEKFKLDWDLVVGFLIAGSFLLVFIFGTYYTAQKDDTMRAQWESWCLAQGATIELDPARVPPTGTSFKAACIYNGTVIGTWN